MFPISSEKTPAWERGLGESREAAQGVADLAQAFLASFNLWSNLNSI